MSTSMPQFLVRGGDGRDYAADVASLMAWAAERRLAPHQYVFITASASWYRAAEVPELRDIFARQQSMSILATPSPPHASAAASEHESRRKFVAGAVIGVILVIFIGGLVVTESKSRTRRPASVGAPSRLDTASVASTPPTSPLNSKATLYASGLDQIAVARTEDAFDRFIKTASRNDTYGYAELAATGDLFLVTSGTEVLVLDYGFARHRIRILEGSNAGASGWVPREWVQQR